MASYIVLIRQASEGCDYTIGCGRTWDFLNFVKDIETEARDYAKQYIEEHEHDCCQIQSIVFYGLRASACTTDLDAIRDEIDNDEDDKERIEYERLKKKFG